MPSGTALTKRSDSSRRPPAGPSTGPKHRGAAGLLPHQAWLFDADRIDREVRLDRGTASHLKDRQLLWIDIHADPKDAGIVPILDLLPLGSESASDVWKPGDRPMLRLAGEFFHLRVVAVRTTGGKDRPTLLDMIAGTNYVVTIHRDPIEALDDIEERISRDTALGQVDSGAFAAVVLDGFLTSYLELADDLGSTVDRLDETALKPSTDTDLLGEMVALRHRIAAARRMLTAHREVVSALARADFEVVAGTSATNHFQALVQRFESAIDAIDGSREALVGTFDIHMTRTSQRTNQIMKTLTIVSVILLPAGVISGFMGMNEKPPFSNDDPLTFWVVVAIIVAIAAFTLAAFRARRWI